MEWQCPTWEADETLAKSSGIDEQCFVYSWEEHESARAYWSWMAWSSYLELQEFLGRLEGRDLGLFLKFTPVLSVFYHHNCLILWLFFPAEFLRA